MRSQTGPVRVPTKGEKSKNACWDRQRFACRVLRLLYTTKDLVMV